MVGCVWMCLDMVGYGWIWLDMFGYVWICLDMVRCVAKHIQPYYYQPHIKFAHPLPWPHFRPDPPHLRQPTCDWHPTPAVPTTTFLPVPMSGRGTASRSQSQGNKIVARPPSPVAPRIKAYRRAAEPVYHLITAMWA